jgi:HEAT repeat protein
MRPARRVSRASIFLAVFTATLAAAQSRAVQPISIRVDTPARAGFPIWVHANLEGPLVARYPFGDDPRDFGSNQLELKRDGEAVTAQPGLSSPGPRGLVAGSIAPQNSPQNRLPLHLGFVIERPGRYSVRWTVIGSDRQPLAQSGWLDFDVVESSAAAREAWLTDHLAKPPSDRGAFVGEYLPSLLAAGRDGRVAQAVMDATYSPVDLIASCALGSLRLFPADVAAPLVLRTLERRGPSSSLAYFVSWHAHWFQDDREQILRTARSFLTSSDDAIVIGALTVLNFARHFDWPNDDPLRDADRAVKTAASTLMSRSDRVAHQLANTLGGTRDPDVRDLLNQIAARHPGAREQALIALRWIDAPNVAIASGSPNLVLRDTLIRLESTDAPIRNAAAQALLDLAQQGLRELLSVSAYLIDDVIRKPGRVGADTWRDAALILGRLRSRSASALTPYLERNGAAEALAEAGEAVVPAVGDVLKVGGPARRRLAAQVLGAIGGAAARAALTAALKQESDPGVRLAIETALSRLR